MPPALTTTSASMLPRSVWTPRTRPAGDVDRGHARVGVDVAAGLARALGERVGQQARVEVAVGRQPRRAEHAVDRHQREALLRLLGRQQLERQPERLRPAGLAARLLPALLRGRQPQPAALDPAAVERPVELDRVHHHPRQRAPSRAAGPTSPAEWNVEPLRELLAVDEHDVAPSPAREVVGDRAAAHAPADDHTAGTARQLTGHARPRARRRSAGPRTRPARARSAPRA